MTHRRGEGYEEQETWETFEIPYGDRHLSNKQGKQQNATRN